MVDNDKIVPDVSDMEVQRIIALF